MAGFYFGMDESTTPHPIRIIPYWSLVIPLTLLSAYLLLSKSRNSTPKKLVETIPEKVA